MGWPGTTATRCGAAAGRCCVGDWAAAGPDTRHANNQAESMDAATTCIRLVSLVIENLTAQTPGDGSGRVGNIALTVLPGESVSARILLLFSTL